MFLVSATRNLWSTEAPYQWLAVGFISTGLKLDILFLSLFFFLQNGCCMPPSQCGFVLKNGSIWTIPKSGLASNHHDCLMWSSKPNRLCYYCYSCKAGFLERLKNDWRKLTTFSICLVSFLIINFIIGCLACRSSQAVGLFQIRRKDQF